MEEPVDSVNWSKLKETERKGAKVVGGIQFLIEILRKNKGKRPMDFKNFASDIEVPIGLAREIVKQKT
ncbi:MAG: hypothetical protein LBT59_18140, partial [Clostridiales bacterium]|nr:hypothetical protein [Clostridiales bacterium]